MRNIIFLLLITIYSSLVVCSQETIHLDNWSFYQKGKNIDYPANVPGTIHTDLFANKLISDPFLNDNEEKAHWIDTCEWIYKTQFNVTLEQLKSAEVTLVFEGLDTYTEILLNGNILSKTDNMFITWKFDVKKLLKAGENSLQIHFYPALKEIQKYNPSKYLTLKEEPRVFARKAQYQFGWDWGPKFTTMGIWKPVYLELLSTESCFRNLSFKQKNLSKEQAVIELKTHLYLPNLKNKYLLQVKDHKTHKIIYSAKLETNVLDVEFSIPNPRLWYPNGSGEQHLYSFDIELLENEKIVQIINKKIGFRTIELVRDRHEKGRSFYFKVNGKPVFMKGANWVPAESFLPRLTRNDYKELLSIAHNSNMNMLRVWGGGIYEYEDFYDLCDEYGILVWQDFMFACALYPANESFLNSVKQEAIENIERISQHTSVALWCGNNENDEGWHNWGWKTQFGKDTNQAWENYKKLFQELLPNLVKKYDPQRYYLSSSPVNGWGKKESMTDGDSHYWGIWWGMEPFEVYKQKVPRFMSEYGFQGFPPMQSIKEYITDSTEHYMISSSMKTHQKHPRGFETIQTYMEREYTIPQNLEDYNYTSQLLQAYGIKMAIEAHRRAKPYCMGSLYWQFNDCWPVISWAGIDYYKRWKAMQYFVKNAFKETIISINKQNENTEIWLITDATTPLAGNMNITLQDFHGNIVYSKDTLVNIKPNESKKIWQFTTSNLVKDTTFTLCNVQFKASNTLVEEVHYFAANKYLKLPKAKINVELDKEGNLLIVSDNLSKNAYFSLNNEEVLCSDNFFDLLPNKTYKIQCNSIKKFNIKDLRIKTLQDIK